MRFGSPRCQTARVLAVISGLTASGIVSGLSAFAQTPLPPIRAVPPPDAGGAAALGARSPLPGVVPVPPPKVAPGLSRPAPAAVGAPSTGGAAYAVRSVSVEGVTALSAADVEQATAGLTGQVTAGQIETARGKLLSLYRDRKYLYTTVKDVWRGPDLVFQVVEAYVADVKLEGDVGPAGTQVLRFLNHLVGQRPVSVAQLERWLLLAQDIPGLTVQSTLNPSEGEPGALTLIAQVSRKPLSGYLSADNRAFHLAGPVQGLLVFNLDSFTGLGERTQVSLFRTYDGTNIFGQISEEFFIGGSGLKLKIYAGAGNTTPGGALKLIGYDADTRVGGMQLSYPLLRSREQRLDLTGAFDVIESDVHDTNSGTSRRSSYDSLRVMRLGFDYALLDTIAGAERGGVNVFNIRYSKGLQILGSGHQGDTSTPPPRLGERVDFGKFSGELSRTQTLFRPTDESTLALHAALGWQYSQDILPPAEKFYLGGARFNRGYYYGQVTGDKGVSATAELRFTTPLPSPGFVPFKLNAQFYAFYDWGGVWQNAPLEADVTVRSAGGGVRFYVGESTEINVEGVHRQSLYPSGQGPGVSALKSTAVYWQVLFRY